MFTARALQKAKKKSDVEKVGLNIKVPIGLKNDFDEACKKCNVSMTEMMLSLMEVFIEDSNGVIDMAESEFIRLANEKIEFNKKTIEKFYESIENKTYKLPNINHISQGFKLFINDIEVEYENIMDIAEREAENSRLRKLMNLKDEEGDLKLGRLMNLNDEEVDLELERLKNLEDNK